MLNKRVLRDVKTEDVNVCPKCESESLTTYDSRNYSGRRSRRKRCRDCGEVFTTVEITNKEYIMFQLMLKSMDKLTEDINKLEVINNGS